MKRRTRKISHIDANPDGTARVWVKHFGADPDTTVILGRKAFESLVKEVIVELNNDCVFDHTPVEMLIRV